MRREEEAHRRHFYVRPREEERNARISVLASAARREEVARRRLSNERSREEERNARISVLASAARREEVARRRLSNVRPREEERDARIPVEGTGDAQGGGEGAADLPTSVPGRRRGTLVSLFWHRRHPGRRRGCRRLSNERQREEEASAFVFLRSPGDAQGGGEGIAGSSIA
ncbi:hypothetical protein [Psychromarinibacter sp. S121]|uniref:hypothetical protein n=1 Tax=Psychromarinibacter sp. S121 TaxID=3415127 RepID=UPI003C7A3A92